MNTITKRINTIIEGKEQYDAVDILILSGMLLFIAGPFAYALVS